MNRLTERRENPLVMSMWAGDSRSLRIYNRLAEYEDIFFDENGNERITPAECAELAQAKREGRVVVLDEKTALAMRAGARAIENNKRLEGTIFIYDIFGDHPKELSYYEAAKILYEAAANALKEREA